MLYKNRSISSYLFKAIVAVAFFCPTAHFSLAYASTTVVTSLQYGEVVKAFNEMVSGRSLMSDEGSQLVFGPGMQQTRANYVVKYAHSFPSGQRANGSESVWTNGSSIYVDQVIEGVIARRYVASIEAPYNVLRIRPEQPEDSEFISRDCIRNSASEGTVCYVKVRYMNDVIVSVYRETPTSN